MTRRTWIGKVKSKPTNQISTVMVEVVALTKHPKYGKILRKLTRHIAHDQFGCRVGDTVEIGEVPRISKTKSKLVLRKVNNNDLF